MANVRVIDLRDNLAYVLSHVVKQKSSITITRRGRAIAEIVPIPQTKEEKQKFKLADPA